MFINYRNVFATFMHFVDNLENKISFFFTFIVIYFHLGVSFFKRYRN